MNDDILRAVNGAVSRCSVQVGIGDQSAVLADVQPAFDTLAVVGCPTRPTGLGRTAFIYALDGDIEFSGFVGSWDYSEFSGAVMRGFSRILSRNLVQDASEDTILVHWTTVSATLRDYNQCYHSK